MEIKKGYTRTCIEESTDEQLIEMLERTAMRCDKAKGESFLYNHMKLVIIEKEIKKRMKH